MPKMIINLNEKENREVDIFRAKNCLGSKEKAIRKIIRIFLKIEKQKKK